MIQTKDRQLLIGGQPRIVMAGEVHYFRVARGEWGQRLDLLVEAGCDTVASYIPWIVHELPDGSIDVEGRTRPERDVAAFIDLAAEKGLRFLARPGPFIMAELKNEGLPYSVYRDHPEVVPSGWDGVPTTSRTVDYLAPAFLKETGRWYDAIMPVLAPRLEPVGGNVVGVQLDNEVGMLAWVTNTPDLTDGLVDAFGAFVRDRHGDASPYSAAPGSDDWASLVRSPSEADAGALRLDLGLFMRRRFGEYVATLRAMCEERAVRDVPFLVNIHGTEGGNGAPFPIGISQLVDTYSGIPGMVSGSDHYLGEATLNTMTDLYVINAYMAAVHDEDQPLTSLEFEAGSGDYGAGAEMQYDPSTADLKTRLCLAQGNKLINYYLFAGGINPPMDEKLGDGNERVSFTGERHGTAAPVGPEGQKGYAYSATAAGIHAVKANEPWLARMTEDHDDVSLGLVLDAYMTEYHHPGSALMTDVVNDLTSFRGAGERKALARSLLLAGFRFGATWLEASEPAAGSTVVVGSGRYLSERVQSRLVAHLSAGGNVVLLGRVPERDLDGTPCTVLADALGVTGAVVRRDFEHYYPSLVAHGWAAPWPEMRAGWVQPLSHSRGDVVLTDVDGDVCGVDVPVGDGRCILLAAQLPSDPAFFGRALAALGVRPGLRLETEWPGVFATTMSSSDGERTLHLINTSGSPARVTVGLDGTAIASGVELVLPARSGHILPLGLSVGGRRLDWASAEVAGVGSDGAITFRPGVDPDAGTTVVVDGEHVRLAPGEHVLA
ncbi:beta-galactosidase [Intrasporangium flavum]|uniref:beta-galactosidase n=1 Tax=Intrasporangium flavum TaxID=1428657 RepID=UPI00096C5969|nr:beta-galactosidase [Intrasporangium flavum]